MRETLTIPKGLNRRTKPTEIIVLLKKVEGPAKININILSKPELPSTHGLSDIENCYKEFGNSHTASMCIHRLRKREKGAGEGGRGKGMP